MGVLRALYNVYTPYPTGFTTCQPPVGAGRPANHAAPGVFLFHKSAAQATLSSARNTREILEARNPATMRKKGWLWHFRFLDPVIQNLINSERPSFVNNLHY